MTQYTRKSAQVLIEAANLQEKKSQDYQNPNSRVLQADYYEHGIETILDIVKAKYLRLVSVSEAIKSGQPVNFESLEDSAIDAINYLSFAVSYLRGDIEGQRDGYDIFNRRITPSQEDSNPNLVPTNFRKKTSNLRPDIGEYPSNDSVGSQR